MFGSMCVYQYQHINAAVFKGFERNKNMLSIFKAKHQSIR